MMNKFTFIFLASIALLACQNNKNGKFTVTGKLDSASNNLITLEIFDFNNTAPVIYDSARVNTDGSFSLEANAGEESIYRLVVDNQDAQQFIFTNDNKDVKVVLNKKNMFASQIEGSASSTELHHFLQSFQQKDLEIVEQFSLVDSLMKKNNRTTSEDSLTKATEDKIQNLIAEGKNSVKKFITETKSPANAYFALYTYALRIFEVNELQEVLKAVTANHKDYAKITEFNKQIQDQLAAINQKSATVNAYPLLQQQAPLLNMTSPDGKNISTADFKGKYVLIDFWASWCGPCRAENPVVVKAYHKYKNKNFTILGVSLDKDKDKWLEAIKDDQLNWTQMSDLKGWESAAVAAYQFSGIPFNVLVDPSGKIIASGLRGDDLDKKLAEILK